MKKCMGCMREYSENGGFCPVCGYSEDQMKEDIAAMPDALAPMTILGGRYILGRTLSCSDFSFVYIAWDALLQKRVAVKEYFPVDTAVRKENNALEAVSEKEHIFNDGKEYFYREFSRLTKNQDLGILAEVYRCIKENNTLYMVMEYVEGCTLQDLFDGTEVMEQEKLSHLFRKLMAAVEALHERKIGHYNLSPDNVMVDENGGIHLVDFGWAKMVTGAEMKCSENFFDEYYIAPEILANREARENADIYSLGTIYYTMLTGELPKKSRKRMKSGSVLKVADAEDQKKINLLAEVNPDKRPSSIREFWNAGKREGGN